jgi:hypothetical protein
LANVLKNHLQYRFFANVLSQIPHFWLIKSLMFRPRAQHHLASELTFAALRGARALVTDLFSGGKQAD